MFLTDFFIHIFTSVPRQKCTTQLLMVQETGYSMAESDMKVCEKATCIWKGMFHCSKYPMYNE